MTLAVRGEREGRQAKVVVEARVAAVGALVAAGRSPALTREAGAAVNQEAGMAAVWEEVHRAADREEVVALVAVCTGE